jgi:hypothetical protein
MAARTRPLTCECVDVVFAHNDAHSLSAVTYTPTLAPGEKNDSNLLNNVSIDVSSDTEIAHAAAAVSAGMGVVGMLSTDVSLREGDAVNTVARLSLRPLGVLAAASAVVADVDVALCLAANSASHERLDTYSTATYKMTRHTRMHACVRRASAHL